MGITRKLKSTQELAEQLVSGGKIMMLKNEYLSAVATNATHPTMKAVWMALEDAKILDGLDSDKKSALYKSLSTSLMFVYKLGIEDSRDV